MDYKRIILLSDVHLTDKNFACRLDDVTVTQWNKLEYVLKYAKDNNMVILQAGDLFDKSRSWDILNKFIDISNKWGVPIYTIFGQHDQTFRTTDSSNMMNILIKTSHLKLLTKKPVALSKFIHVYGCSYGNDVPAIANKKVKNILVVHQEIGSTKMKIGETEITGAEEFAGKYIDYDLILCGDIHEEFYYNTKNGFILNTGCMLRKTVDLIDHKPCFAVLDTDVWYLSRHEIPFEKRVISREHIDKDKERKNLMDDFISSLNKTEVHGTDFKSNLDRYIKENKIPEKVASIINDIMEKEDENSNK